MSPGYTTEFMHVYSCEDLEYDPLPADEGEDITLVRLTPQEMSICISDGIIEDAKTIAAVLQYESKRY